MLPELIAAIKAAPPAADAFFPRAANPFPPGTPVETVSAALGPIESGFSAIYDASAATTPVGLDGLKESEETIKGVDGNDIHLYITRPAAAGSYPLVLHIHGGGMVLMSTTNVFFVQWRRVLAKQGLIVVGVEYRNAGGGRLGNHPFPAGLNDCAAAVDWIRANLGKVGATTVTLLGESGGGNLAIATTLKLLRDGKKGAVSGVYAMCPCVAL